MSDGAAPGRRVCVFAGTGNGTRPEYLDAARALGREIAARGLGLVYGGGRLGMMGALAGAVLDAGGHVTGVIPRFLVKREQADRTLSEMHVVETMHERKALMTDLSRAFVALPGGLGTLDELFEALTWSQLGLHANPCGVLNVCGYYDGLIGFLDHQRAEGFIRAEYGELLAVHTEPGALLDRLL